jgi:hypothetical protein
MTYRTRMDWNGREWMVTLSRGTIMLAGMSLVDWLELEATQYAIEDAVNCVPEVLDLEQLIDD